MDKRVNEEMDERMNDERMNERTNERTNERFIKLHWYIQCFVFVFFSLSLFFLLRERALIGLAKCSNEKVHIKSVQLRMYDVDIMDSRNTRRFENNYLLLFAALPS